MQQDMTLEILKKFDPEAVSSLSRDRTVYYSAKRIFDMAVAFLALLFLSPLMLLIALALKLDSSGPVFFVQKRVGAVRRKRNGYSYWRQTNFSCFKFRTMKHKVDTSLHEQFIKAYINNDQAEMNALQGGNQPVRKLANDPRVTRMGRILRKTSLDELPQLWNILRGEMSLVGPRPAIPYELKYFKAWHYQRMQALPGLTGLWQIRSRCSTDFDAGVRLDIEYVEKQSFLLDLIILMETPFAVIFKKGAA